MFAEQLTRAQWIDRCAMRLGALPPAMDPTDASLRAAQIAHDGGGLAPEEAAAVYLELPDSPLEELSDYEKYDFATWKLVYVLDDDSPASASGLQAAAAVFEAQGVMPAAGMLAQFKLECWDDSDMAKELELTDEEHKAQRVWILASRAAEAADPASSIGQGRLAMQWPSKVRWEAARAHWAQGRRSKS